MHLKWIPVNSLSVSQRYCIALSCLLIMRLPCEGRHRRLSDFSSRKAPDQRSKYTWKYHSYAVDVLVNKPQYSYSLRWTRVVLRENHKVFGLSISVKKASIRPTDANTAVCQRQLAELVGLISKFLNLNFNSSAQGTIDNLASRVYWRMPFQPKSCSSLFRFIRT